MKQQSPKLTIKTVWKNLTKINFLHTILATYMICTGFILLLNKTYFIWPPALTLFLNDDIIGFIGILDGLGVFYWASINSLNKRLNQLLLLTAGGFVSMLAFFEMGHAIFLGLPRMYVKAIDDIVVFLLIQYIAKHSVTK